jgi:hypothetical protein
VSSASLRCDASTEAISKIVSKNSYHARQAAAALLKMAKVSSDPTVAGRLVEAAADLKDQVGEVPPQVSIKPPDVQTEGGSG